MDELRGSGHFQPEAFYETIQMSFDDPMHLKKCPCLVLAKEERVSSFHLLSR